MIWQEQKHDIAPVEPVVATEPARNETIVLRRDRRIVARASLGVSDDDEAGVQTGPWSYSRVIQTLRFLNPGAAEIGTRSAPSGVNPRTQGKASPTENRTYRSEGTASWYGPDFHGRRTANGERYDMNGISAAHRTMPMPSYARVTNLDNGRSIIVRVNNRGPFVHGRVADLSVGAAKALDFYRKGTTKVRVEFVARAPAEGGEDQMLLATLREGTPAPVPSNVMVASAKPSLAKAAEASGN
jgi:rare lipoprotein A (peptidoglycan hydrolase)